MLHRACKQIEGDLRVRVGDLQEEVRALRDQLVDQQERSNAREKDLLDRLMSIEHPMAHRNLVAGRAAEMRAAQANYSDQPAALPPAIPRGSIAGVTTSGRSVFSNPLAIKYDKAGVKPKLSPVERNYEKEIADAKARIVKNVGETADGTPQAFSVTKGADQEKQA